MGFCSVAQRFSVRNGTLPQGSASAGRLFHLPSHTLDCPAVGSKGDKCRCLLLRLTWRFVADTFSEHCKGFSSAIQAWGVRRVLYIPTGIWGEHRGASVRPTQVIRGSQVQLFCWAWLICTPARPVGHTCRRGQAERPRKGRRQQQQLKTFSP